MELHVAALFNHDERGRITGTNNGEPPGIAPRLYLGRTREGNVWRFRSDLPDELVAELTRILETEPVIANLRQPPVTLPRVREILSPVDPSNGIHTGPAFQFPPEIPEAVGIETIDPSNIGFVKKQFPDHYAWLCDEYTIRQPIFAIVREGVAVSICYSARMKPEAAEAGVDTAEEYRGQGLAASVTLAWASGIRGMGRVPLYSTSWENVASQRVAAKLGLVMSGADLSIP